MILQRVRLCPDRPPRAPYVQRAPDGGWHHDCGNCYGWSFDFPVVGEALLKAAREQATSEGRNE